MPATTAGRVHRVSMRIAMAGTPVTLGALVVWAFRLVPDRPTLVFMVYQMLLLGTLSAGVVAAISKGQIAIARAFAAGYNTALAVVQQDEPGDTNGGSRPKHRAKPIPLRLVE